MFCTKCGEKNEEGTKFCIKCGNIIQTNNINNNVSTKNKKDDSSIGIVGFIFSLLGIITCGLTSIIGFILCLIGVISSKKKGEKDNFSLAGLIISSIFLLFIIALLIIIVFTSETVTVDDFSEKTYTEAKVYCDNNSLNCNISQKYSDTIPSGSLISQSIPAGEEIKSYTQVDLIYSKGKRIEKNEDSNKVKKEEIQKSDEQKKQDYITSCGTYGYKDIARQPDEYKGKKAKFRGKVIQVSENFFDNNKVDLRVNVTQGEYGLWDDTIYVTYKYTDKEDKILEDDIINMYGTISGTETYVSVLGAKITIPSFNAKYITIEK